MRFAPVSWLASKDVRVGRTFLSDQSRNPVLPRPFPDSSSGPRRCPRLQLRGSAGFPPASLSLCPRIRHRDTRTRERIESTTNVHGAGGGCQFREGGVGMTRIDPKFYGICRTLPRVCDSFFPARVCSRSSFPTRRRASTSSCRRSSSASLRRKTSTGFFIAVERRRDSAAHQ